MPTVILVLVAYPAMAAQFVATKLGLNAGLTAWDIMACRYGLGALAALAVVLFDRRRRAMLTAEPGKFALVALLGGAAYGGIFAFATGLMPASHSTLFAPASSLVCTLVVAGLVLGVWPSRVRLAGVAVILVGLFIFARAAGAEFDLTALRGDVLFGLIGLMWGGFSVLARRWNLDPLTCVVAMAATGIIAIPVWLLWLPSGLGSGNLLAALGEAVFQGLILMFGAFLAYVTLVQRLGPSTAALGIAMVPPMGVVIAMFVLGETARPGQWLGAAIAVTGLLVSTGIGAEPMRRGLAARRERRLGRLT